MIQKLKEMIETSQNIVFFGGAGTSTESHIPDFRSSGGIYSKAYGGLSPEEILSHAFLHRHSELFFQFLKEKLYFPQAEPHIGHKALVELERIGKLKGIITQNIDNLHQKAGSKNVIELHGSIYRNYCVSCGARYTLNTILNSKTNVPKCEICDSMIRPDVTLYGEALNSNVVNNAITLLLEADMVIVCGTSLVVYPAAGFLEYYRGHKLVLVNITDTPYNNKADLVIKGGFGEVFSAL